MAPPAIRPDGRRQYTIHGTLFELPARYELHKAADHDGGRSVGYSTYGPACEAYDRVLGRKVTVKKMEGVLQQSRAKSARFAKELQLLGRLGHYGIVKILNCFGPSRDGADPDERVTDIYSIVPSYDSTLMTIIRSPQILSPGHVKLIAFQLLETLSYLHENGVVATRICPSNILCDVSCSLCLSELGAAVAVPTADAPHNVDPAVPADDDERSERWYKAPELLLRAPTLTPACDVWSVGLIIAELLFRRPIFPGADFVDQVRLVTDTLGIERQEERGTAVTKAELQRAQEGPLGFLGTGADADKTRSFLLAMGPKLRVPLRTLLPGANKYLCDIVERMVRFTPDDRDTVANLQRHPYFEGMAPRSVTFEKDEADLLDIDVKNNILVDVPADSLGDEVGLAQYTGYSITSINATSIAETNNAAAAPHLLTGKGLAHMTFRFGAVEEKPLAGLPWANTMEMDEFLLNRVFREEINLLRN